MVTLVAVAALALSALVVAAPGFAQPRRSPDTGRSEFVPPPASLVSSSVIGARVMDAAGKDLGELEQLLFEPKSGRVSHVVLGLGGLAGVGEAKVVVKWSDLRLRPDDINPRRTIAGIDQAVIDRAPRWDRRGRERDLLPPAASPTTIPPGPAPPLPPGKRY